MDTKILQRFLENLRRKRENLLEWLNATPASKKQIRLGPSNEQAVQAHLHVLDDAIAKAENRTLGLCEVCHEYVETSQLEMDFTASVCIDHYSAEQKRQLETELELSRKLQKALLPQEIPQIPGLKIAAFTKPAKIVGGDYFDFFRFRDDVHGVAIADIMGKGLPASMLMASLQSSLRILVPENDSPAAVVEKLNKLFCHNIHLVQFITLFLARYDSQSRVLEYCNAGHNPPLLVRRQPGDGSSVQWLKPTGAAIGLAESFTFAVEKIILSPGDIFVIYTDGVSEAMNSKEEEFGEKRLAEFVRKASHLTAHQLVHELQRTLLQYTEGRGLHDDFTIMVGKVE